MRLLGLLPLLLGLIFPTAGGQQRNDGHQGSYERHLEIRAENYLHWPTAQQVGYAMGFMDGIYTSLPITSSKKETPLASLANCIAEMTPSQISAIIEKHIKDHPDRWHWPLNTMAFNAIHDACPR